MLEVHDHTDQPHGLIRELRLARPPANALSPELVSALLTAVTGAADEGAKALVLSGAPGMFSAGLDVPHLLTLDKPAIYAMWNDFYGLMRALASSPIPVVAALTGHSPAGGAVLAMWCDRRIMAERAGEKPFRIGLNEVRVGLGLPPVIFRGLAWIVGQRQASRMVIEGLMLTSSEAHAVGFVDELAPIDEVVERSVAWCQSLLQLPPKAMHYTRNLSRQGLFDQFNADEQEIEASTTMWFSDETQAAMKALVASLAARKA